MKALLKGGLCLALCWAAVNSGAQEIAFRSAAPATAIPAVGSNAPGELRAVSLNRPEPILGSQTTSELRTVRAQTADDKPLPQGPALGNPPRPMAPGTLAAPPMSNAPEFTAPAPKPVQSHPPEVISPSPSRIWGNPLADMCDCAPIQGDCCGSVCGPMSCNDCGGCGGGWFSGCCERCTTDLFWVSAEYLLWFTRSQSVTPLVTVSPTGTPLAQSGVLGFPTTTSAFDHINNNPYSGGRFSAGIWLPGTCDWGVDATYFFLGRQTNTQSFGSGGDPQYSRPVIDANSGANVAQLVAFPGIVNGIAVVSNYSELWGLDINLRKRVCCGCNYWLDLLGGYRHLDLVEGLSVSENLNVLNPNGTVAGNIVVVDSFRTTNRFDGAQLGIQGQWNFTPRFFLGASFKLGFGNVHQTIDINGSTTFTGFGVPGAINGTRNGGILALPTNIGHWNQNRFAVLPEVGVKVGMDLTQHLRVYFGYDFLYLSDVVRPGDQIDPVINRSQLPQVTIPGTPPLVGPRRPTVLFRTTDYWAQGVNWGIQYHW